MIDCRAFDSGVEGHALTPERVRVAGAAPTRFAQSRANKYRAVGFESGLLNTILAAIPTP